MCNTESHSFIIVFFVFTEHPNIQHKMKSPNDDPCGDVDHKQSDSKGSHAKEGLEVMQTEEIG